MPGSRSADRSQIESAIGVLAFPGRVIYSLAFIAIGVQTIVCSHMVQQPLGDGYNAVPVIPWVPAIPAFAWIAGILWILCALGLLTRNPSFRAAAAITLGSLFAVWTLFMIVPVYAKHLDDMGLRTVVFEPLTLACIALLLMGSAAPIWLVRLSRVLIAIGLVVFGVDHFIGLVFIANLLPAWIPFHQFWVIFFGFGLVAGGVSIATGVFYRLAAAGTGLIFGIWFVSLHLPRVLGLYGIAGAPQNPNEWSSMLIAFGLWGGFWALVGQPVKKA